MGMAWNFISLFLMIWVPESPRYLVATGRLEEAHKAFETIAWWNNKKLIWEEHLYSKSGKVKVRPAMVGSEESNTSG